MGKETYNVKTVVTQYRCDQCGFDYVKFTGMTFTSNPPRYQHKCSHCGFLIELLSRYPLTRYVADPENIPNANFQTDSTKRTTD